MCQCKTSTLQYFYLLKYIHCNIAFFNASFNTHKFIIYQRYKSKPFPPDLLNFYVQSKKNKILKIDTIYWSNLKLFIDCSLGTVLKECHL